MGAGKGPEPGQPLARGIEQLHGAGLGQGLGQGRQRHEAEFSPHGGIGAHVIGQCQHFLECGGKEQHLAPMHIALDVAHAAQRIEPVEITKVGQRLRDFVKEGKTGPLRRPLENQRLAEAEIVREIGERIGFHQQSVIDQRPRLFRRQVRFGQHGTHQFNRLRQAPTPPSSISTPGLCPEPKISQ